MVSDKSVTPHAAGLTRANGISVPKGNNVKPPGILGLLLSPSNLNFLEHASHPTSANHRTVTKTARVCSMLSTSSYQAYLFTY